SDGINNSTTCFELTRIIESDQTGGLQIETRHAYSVVGGIWKRSSTTTDPGGLARATSFTYSGEDGAWGDVTTQNSPLSNKVVRTYDDADRVLTEQHKDAQDTLLAENTYSYDRFGRVLTTTDGLGRSTEKEYDAAGRLKKVSQGILDLAGQNEEVTGNVTFYNYLETTGLVKEITRAARNNTQVTVQTNDYDYAGRLTTSKDGRNNETTYEYDYRGRLTQTRADIDPGNSQYLYGVYLYDNMDRTTESKQYDGDPDSSGVLMADSKVEYDEAGRIVRRKALNPGNSNYAITTNYYFDKAGQLRRVKDDSNHQTDYTYDPAGRQYKIEDHLGNYTVYRFNKAGESVRLATKHKLDATPTWRTELVFQYFDDDGRLKTVSNWGKTVIPDDFALKEDPADWGDESYPSEPSASDSTKLVTKYSYDGLARTTQVTDPDGRVTETAYDKLSRVTSTAEDKNSINRSTTYAYDQEDAQGKFYEKITADNGGITKYYRDEAKDAMRVSKVIYPDSGEVSYTYNNDGTLATRTDQRSWVTTYTRDSLDRVTQEAATRSGGSVDGTRYVRYTYDVLSRLLTVEDDNHQDSGGNPDYDFSKVEYVYTWEANGTDLTIHEKQHLAGSSARTATAIVTGDGVRESLTYPNSRPISFTHDGLHRLTGVTEGGNTIGDYAFKGRYMQDRGIGNNGGSRIVKLTLRDQADLDGYDRWGRITWMRHYKVSGGTDIAEFGYGYSYASDRNYQEDLVNTTADEYYTYDTLHRLTNYKRGDLNANKDGITGTPSREQTWVLDSLGNWDNPSGLAIDSNDSGSDGTPSDARTHFSVNEIDTIDPEGAIGSFDVIHDDAGNLRILPDRTDPTNKADKHVYDYRNRLIEIWHTTQYDGENPESSPWGDNPVVQYFYDGLNRRAKKDLNSGTDVIYLYDGWRCIEEREDDGGTWEARRQYVYGGLYIDEPLIFDKDTDNDGDCTDAGGSSRFFYCQQANFNVVALAESDGDVVEKIKYDPYGEYGFILDGSTGNMLLFQGQRWDNDAGLYYFRNRDLSPVLGRFMQRDRLGYVDGLNKYAFVSDSPLNLTDFLGLEESPKCKELSIKVVKSAGSFSAIMRGVPGADLDIVELSVPLLAGATIGEAGPEIAFKYEIDPRTGEAKKVPAGLPKTWKLRMFAFSVRVYLDWNGVASWEKLREHNKEHPDCPIQGLRQENTTVTYTGGQKYDWHDIWATLNKKEPETSVDKGFVAYEDSPGVYFTGLPGDESMVEAAKLDQVQGSFDVVVVGCEKTGPKITWSFSLKKDDKGHWTAAGPSTK
ncbi:MAG TPA: RHS repeat-associated core domain-containing protein, partial [Armatimonadota bacterium]|nr:RHS repeat-associated core domain-containing protein [Armatimonadota bacterium]